MHAYKVFLCSIKIDRLLYTYFYSYFVNTVTLLCIECVFHDVERRRRGARIRMKIEILVGKTVLGEGGTKNIHNGI